MAVTKTDSLIAEVAWPDTPVDDLALDYDEPSDTLYLYLLGGPRPGVVWPLDTDDDDTIALKIDEKSNLVVYIMIEGFFANAVVHHPAWRDLIAFAGGDAPAVMARREMSLSGRNRSMVLTHFIADVKTVWKASN